MTVMSTADPLAAVHTYIAAFNDGDQAYLVLPATMTFSVGGTQVTQDGASFTGALGRSASGWRITAWAWTKGRQRQ
ncbi:hypothetical protein AU189_06900 [Mycolicibacterium acapulense]|uniref:SnoaL-like domain-containing protein n=1 Tax=Mycobacterium lehmannii TaxID=2048550 RepID=A0A101A3V0_9MYCO|nr:hypothetical protein AU189_06900 [Mycolicibacterium acapulense]KUI12473.1 hypothetical protein AU192_20750 [Mycobacterium lehmannii]